MQGYIDLKDCNWNDSKQTLSGISSVIKNEPYKIIIATNGKTVQSCNSNKGKAAIKPVDEKINWLNLL